MTSIFLAITECITLVHLKLPQLNIFKEISSIAPPRRA